MLGSVKQTVVNLVDYWKSPTQRGDFVKDFAFDSRGYDFANFVAITLTNKNCEACRSLLGLAYIVSFIGICGGLFGIAGFLLCSLFWCLFFWLWRCYIVSIQEKIDRGEA